MPKHPECIETKCMSKDIIGKWIFVLPRPLRELLEEDCWDDQNQSTQSLIAADQFTAWMESYRNAENAEPKGAYEIANAWLAWRDGR